MHLVVIAWLYVVLMMSLAEAFGTQGTVLGALFTFLLYGVLPLSIVVYILGTPARKKALRQSAGAAPEQAPAPDSNATAPNASGHAAGAAPAPGVAPVREEQRGL
ncbi:MAG: hypothetical protein RL559_650 [Pseudomonadota bacterium]